MKLKFFYLKKYVIIVWKGGGGVGVKNNKYMVLGLFYVYILKKLRNEINNIYFF